MQWNRRRVGSCGMSRPVIALAAFSLAAAFRSETKTASTHGSRRKNQREVIHNHDQHRAALEQSLGCKHASSTEPDVTAVAVASRMLRAAIESTIGKRSAAGVVDLGRPDLDFDCVLAAMMNPLGVRLHTRPDPDASPSKLIFDLAPPSHDPRLETLSAVVNRR
jgi:hypothetical protein